MTIISSAFDNSMMNATNLRLNRMTIEEFYKGRSIFITGGTGFIGKVLIEKLLRSCPGIKNIYLLIRPKREQNESERLNELLNSSLFDKIKQKDSKCFEKLIPINGDITAEKLGISESDQELLCKNVSIVFHSAANIKFNEKLKLAITINVMGTKRLIDLCHRMRSLLAFIHVSTAYSNCDRQQEIKEIVYTTSYQPNDIITLINILEDDTIDTLTPILIGDKPNTYTFTKALTEQLLLKEADEKNLPVAIIRPSIVISANEEPSPGWLDNMNGPTGPILGIGNGLIRTLICEKDCIVDLIPVDMVINLMISAAWNIAINKSEKIKIYNCVTCQKNPITWKVFFDITLKQMIKHPFKDVIWYPTLKLQMNRSMKKFQSIFIHYMPAYLIDFCCRVTGKKTKLVQTTHRLEKALNVFEYFTTQQWNFMDDNVRELMSDMNVHDRKLFQFDVCKIDWEIYLEKYVLGCREHLLKQKPGNINTKNMQRLYGKHQLFKILMVLLSLTLITYLFPFM